MSRSYGTMIGCMDAITWVRNLMGVDKAIQDRVIARMQYEFDKDIPVPPKYHKGLYGRKYDSYTCGNCGTTISRDVCSNFCDNCGFRIKWDNPRCLTGYKQSEKEAPKQLSLFDYIAE